MTIRSLYHNDIKITARILITNKKTTQLEISYKIKGILKVAFTFVLPFSLAYSFEDEPTLSSLSSRLNCCGFMELFEPNSSKTHLGKCFRRRQIYASDIMRQGVALCRLNKHRKRKQS